jgi:hypothetical protein
LDNTYAPQFNYKSNFITRKITISSVLNYKFNAKNSIRSGVYLNQYSYALRQRYVDHEADQIVQPLNSTLRANTMQVFSQWSYRAMQKLTINSGIHFLYLKDNSTYSVEPRASAKYDLNDRESFSIGYGLHSQMQPIGVYEASIEQADGSFSQSNRNLGFNKAHHFVAGYDRSLTKFLRVKTETYYQQLYNIAVKNDPASPLSSLVVEEGFVTDPMVNKGYGRNYGVELTLEQFLHNNLYFLLSASLYNSEYKALDGVWRNTRFNGKRALSFTAGKEYNWKKNRVFGLNIRAIYTGGFWTSPIDFDKSMELGETRYVESLAFTQKLPDYFRTDVRISLKRNREKTTTTLSLDLQNATNHKNLGGQYFEVRSGEIKKWYSLPLLPILNYKIEF